MMVPHVGASRINPYTRPYNENTKIGQFLFVEFWHQIWFQKY
jgi:hypothetical protein